MHSLQVYGISGVEPTTAACLADLLRSFADYSTTGAAHARGFGQIAFEAYQAGPGVTLADPEVYLSYCEENREKMAAWALSGPSGAFPKADKGKPSKGRTPAARQGPAAVDPEPTGVF